VINLNDLVVFLTAAECDSFSEAGRRLHLSQPAISQKIDGLERRFGAKLFFRQGRTVRLTEAGQSLKPMAGELLAAARRLDETMASLQGEVTGEMTIGCSTASGKYLLPALIARFRRQFSQVRINVHMGSRASVMEKLVCGEITLGVSSKKIEHRDLDYRQFFTDEVILIVAQDHRWARYRHVYVDDLLDEPFILREEVAGTREVLFEALGQKDITPDMLKIAMVLGNTEAVVLAVGEGIGVAFVSRLAAQRDLDIGRVVAVEVEGMDLKREIYLVRNRRIPATRAQSEFLAFVEAEKRSVELSPAS